MANPLSSPEFLSAMAGAIVGGSLALAGGWFQTRAMLRESTLNRLRTQLQSIVAASADSYFVAINLPNVLSNEPIQVNVFHDMRAQLLRNFEEFNRARRSLLIEPAIDDALDAIITHSSKIIAGALEAVDLARQSATATDKTKIHGLNRDLGRLEDDLSEHFESLEECTRDALRSAGRPRFPFRRG